MMIKDIFERSDGTYGYRRIQVVLERRGVRADGSTIRAIMRDLGLQAAGPRVKVRTTVPAQDLDERPDLLRRDFTADEPGRKWCGDIPPQAGGAPLLYQDVDRVRLSCDRSGLLHEKGGGLCDGRPHAHVPGVPGH